MADANRIRVFIVDDHALVRSGLRQFIETFDDLILDFYQPHVKHVTIHEGKLAEGHYAYNHMASVEWFDGRFHCVWGAHAETHLEGKPGQVNVWATSDDFEHWSAPQRLAHTGRGALPADPQCVQWQPNLLNYRDRQLWCVWTFNSKNAELDGGSGLARWSKAVSTGALVASSDGRTSTASRAPSSPARTRFSLRRAACSRR